VAVALPLFFALMALVVDGGNVLVHKRNIQVAADAAALAMAQDVNPATSTCSPACVDLGREYAAKNGVNVDSTWHQCDSTHTTNCWIYPYVDGAGSHNDEVEVRLQAPVSTFFVGVADALLHGGVATTFNVDARAVAQSNPVLGVTTIPGPTYTGSTTIVPGDTHTTTDPDTLSGGSGVAFTMSRDCAAITYGGNPKGAVVGAFATNGGLTFSGFGNAKKVFSLASNRTGCPNAPVSPPSGVPSQCTSTDPSWGDATTSDNLCVRNLLSLHGPITWPLTPPALPTPKTGPQAGTWQPANDYPSKCISLGNVSTSFSTTGNPPGVYCVSGAGVLLTLNNLGDLTGGDGYTFFALDGAKINVAGNTNILKFYWPSACGPRPTSRGSFTCFGRTVSNYNPQTLLYATSTTTDTTTCANNAICLNGQSNSLTGDIFATKPDVFPPPAPGLPQPGGGVASEGGGLASGQGFIESWFLSLTGNTGTYRGTGASIVLPGATHTTTDPSTTIIVTGSTGAATTQATTIGTNLDLSQ
jgi:Putative Flp pilus-assembly TadE/G-like